jgi:hypothetical protein
MNLHFENKELVEKIIDLLVGLTQQECQAILLKVSVDTDTQFYELQKNEFLEIRLKR